jgi:hypothetical protein
MPEEIKNKISEALQKHFQEKGGSKLLGRPRSEETKKKISETLQLL